jgi:hypothetical protein
MDDTCEWVNLTEAAACLATDLRTLDLLVEWGLVPAYRTWSLTLIRRADVTALMSSSPKSPPSPSFDGGGGRGAGGRSDPPRCHEVGHRFDRGAHVLAGADRVPAPRGAYP